MDQPKDYSEEKHNLFQPSGDSKKEIPAWVIWAGGLVLTWGAIALLWWCL